MKQSKIKLAAIAKNEAAYIPEWVFHHFFFGFDAIEIWINNSEDNSFEILECLQTVYGKRLQFVDADNIFNDCLRNNRNFQTTSYQKIFSSSQQEGFDYILFLDLDEFWTPCDFITDIKTFVNEFEANNPSSISFQWFLDTPDINRLPFSRPYESRMVLLKNRHVKSLLNLHETPSYISIHNSIFSNGRYFLANKDVFEENNKDEQFNKAKVSLSYFDGNKNNIDRVFILHRIYRSQFEYVSILSKGRKHANDFKLIKVNRPGYINDKYSSEPLVLNIDEKILERYDSSYKADISDCELEQLEIAIKHVENRFLSFVELLKEDHNFLFKKYSNIFDGVQLSAINDIRNLIIDQESEKTDFHVETLEIVNGSLLSITGWLMTGSSQLQAQDTSIYIGDEKIEFTFCEGITVDSNNNDMASKYPFEISVSVHDSGLHKKLKEKITIRIGNAQKEFDNPYQSFGKNNLNNALSLLSKGDFASAKAAFLNGVKEFPNLLDQYGHPSFKKELMRSLLNRRNWAEAQELIPKRGEPGGANWHEILFARSYMQASDLVNAESWWQRVLDRDPGHAEALAFFLQQTDRKQLVAEANKPWNIDSIPMRPIMELEGQQRLEELLKKSEVFLEYGAGGSTVLAASLGVKDIYSVESDQAFLNAVEAKITTIFPNKKIQAHFVDIGHTKEFGYPIDPQSANRWPNYCVAPWQTLIKNNRSPDLILIDGRFRVACFLLSALSASSGTIILFDDYFDRPHYHVVEKYYSPNRKIGRMAEFVISVQDIKKSIYLDLINHITNPA